LTQLIDFFVDFRCAIAKTFIGDFVWKSFFSQNSKDKIEKFDFGNDFEKLLFKISLKKSFKESPVRAYANTG
jgi:hypothetical protein